MLSLPDRWQHKTCKEKQSKEKRSLAFAKPSIEDSAEEEVEEEVRVDDECVFTNPNPLTP